MKKTKVQEINDYIEQLKGSMDADMDRADRLLKEALERAAKAETAMETATKDMDVDAYQAAKAEKEKAEMAIKVYTNRQGQIITRQTITEEESDLVIDGLLEYEALQDAKIRKVIQEHIEALAQACTKYFDEISAAELTIMRWTSEIRPNYKDRDQGTRSAEAIPVRRFPYMGCYEAKTTHDYVKHIKEGDPQERARRLYENTVREAARQKREREQAKQAAQAQSIADQAEALTEQAEAQKRKLRII